MTLAPDARPPTRDQYRGWYEVPTRWADTDQYGHVNNIQYYSYFDTVVTRWLIEQGGLRPSDGPVIGLCVESQCAFHASISFPTIVVAGLRVAHVGGSSVRYEIGLFPAGSANAAGSGHFVHVYVDRITRRPIRVPTFLRTQLTQLVSESGDAA